MALMKFYFTPGACSIGIHILLQELDLLFEAYPVNLLKGESQTPEFLAMNPKGTIPVLVLEDGTALTDFVSIAWWLARQYPDQGWIPSGVMEEVAELDRLNYAVHVIHGQGFTRVFTPDRYNPYSIEHPRIEAEGKAMVVKSLNYLNPLLEAESTEEEKVFRVSDAALFYVEFWAVRSGIELPSACEKHYQKLLKRLAVQQVLLEEGYYSAVNQSLAKEGVT